MIDFETFYQRLSHTPLARWAATLAPLLTTKFSDIRHGDYPRWLAAVEGLPEVATTHVDLNSAAVTTQGAATEAERQQIEAQLRDLMPWRKGPFDIHGVQIETEWRSDWKWQRIAPHLSPLTGRTVLDVGCGSGYHCWRMIGAGAELVVGIDPSLLFTMQFLAVQRYVANPNVFVLPLAMEEMPANLQAFDTVFSMGVLYHRRSPIDHINELKGALKPGGELVLETLVIDGGLGEVFMPEDRYAMMRNVWFIPTVATLELWLRRCGFKNIRTVDLNQTSTEEQHSTDWMQFDSLPDFLDPENPNLTSEGHAAPKRAVLIAQR